MPSARPASFTAQLRHAVACCNMVHVTVPTLACFRQGKMWHAVACGCFATGHTSWCLRWLASGKASFLHSTAAACSHICNMAHVMVPMLGCLRQGQLWYAVVCSCFVTGQTYTCAGLLLARPVLFTAKLWHAVACRCSCNLSLVVMLMLAPFEAMSALLTT